VTATLAPERPSVIDHPSGFLALSPRMQHRPYNNGTPGFLGPAHAPFKPEDEGRNDLTLNGISVERLEDRKRLLSSLDQFRRDADGQKMMEGFDAYTDQAFGMLTSSKLARALGELERRDACRAMNQRHAGYRTTIAASQTP